MNWSDGYNIDVEYTFKYFAYLSPVYQRFAALLNGYDLPPASEDAVHMELAVGQGLSINFHAACNLGSFIGNDFHPSHALHAQQLAARSGLKIDLTDDSFEQMLNRPDLPMCNSISIHGVWSWISDQNRLHILNIIKRCLKPGGVVYNSYNINAGSMIWKPWRDMMKRFYDCQKGSEIDRFEATIQYFKEIFDKNPHIMQDNLALQNKWNHMTSVSQDPHYLLQEYFNEYWDSCDTSEMAAYFEEAKLTLIGPANCGHVWKFLEFSGDTLQFMLNQTSPLLYSSWRDLLLRTSFRSDLYVKGGQFLSEQAIFAKLNCYRFVLTVPAKELKNNIFQSDYEYDEEVFKALQETFSAQDYEPKTFLQLYESVKALGSSQTDLLIFLVSKMQVGQVQVCASKVNQTLFVQSQALNKVLLESDDYQFKTDTLVSPVTGQGVLVDWSHRVVLQLWLEDIHMADDVVLTRFIAQLRRNKKQFFNLDKTILSREDEKTFFLEHILPYAKSYVPIWRQLGLL
ncbi:putative methyltransferase [Vitreoscilla sp. C1]|uniref:class I SAM-dependent methyltransferase n=1 Tax=Vitreoscilla sp. (strain C1) TaxID=96942 RepID=UPI00148EE318|nr:class I SAM-dependent methyltransferase [Vitreoscilla sp. C1]AUZ06177.2 putative methyltransferase [Vitreoscilla sp. C1]